MLMTNPTDKLVNVSGFKRFYTVRPNGEKDIPDKFVDAAKVHGLVESKNKPHKTEIPPKRETKKEVSKEASHSSFDVSIDSEMEAKMLLDQKGETIIGDLKEITISKSDLRKLHDYEKSHRNRPKVLRYIGGRIK